MRIEHEATISQPPEVVFPWIADPQKAMKWQKNVTGGEIIVNKPEGIGTTFKETIQEDGNSLEMSGTITKYIPNRIIGFHLDSKIHKFDVTYTLEAINGKTKFRIEAIITWKFPMNVVCLFVGKKIEEGLVRQLRSETLDLSKICEME